MEPERKYVIDRAGDSWVVVLQIRQPLSLHSTEEAARAAVRRYQVLDPTSVRPVLP